VKSPPLAPGFQIAREVTAVPLYEYQCEKCGQRVEIIQRVSDKPYSHCPKCGGDMKKLFSAPAIQFKGSGFYKTDYPSSTASASQGSEGSKSDAKSESKGEGKSEGKSEGKTEGKSEGKSETKSETKSESKTEKKSD
jgi:putative FmdB family regulatory protein